MAVTVPPAAVETGRDIPLNISVVNTGDEAAYDVQLSLMLPDGFEAEPIPVGLLPPNAPYADSFRVRVADSVKPGTYPAVLKTHYADANAYPFSTVSPAFIRYGQSTPNRLQGRLRELSLAGERTGELVLEAGNLDDRPHTVSVRLHLPDELVAEYYSRTVEVRPRGAEKVGFQVKSLGALPDSSYAVFATMEYDEGGLHYSSAAGGVVRILSGDAGGADFMSWLPPAALVALISLFIYIQFRR